MISYDEALNIARRQVEPLGTREMDTREAAGRVLARNVEARRSSPPFDKAAMDGYAVRQADVQDLPVELEVAAESFAGSPADAEIGPGQCVQITTGAPVPPGGDMVVMKEHVEHPAEGRVRVKRLSGGNICSAGEDIREGDTVLEAGELLTPMKAGVAASAGHARVEVYRRPSAALLCTGTEVVEPGEEAGPGQIYNANGTLLRSLLGPWTTDVEYLGTVGDDRGELERRLARGLEADLLVVTGGVSVGEYDLVPDALEKLGVETAFHGWSVKPGKPTLFGKRNDTSVFGLPGNPLSSAVTFYVLMRPALAAMKAGGGAVEPATGIMDENVSTKEGRLRFKPCRVVERGGEMRLRTVEINGSADIAGGSRADGFIMDPGDVTELSEGQRVRFMRTHT